ncbi:MAG: 50S ribosomal protein L10 [Spirochaetaceae bacterium]
MMAYETRVTDQKIAHVAEVKELFSSAKDYVFTDFRGLSVDQITTLRNTLREKQAEYKVIKNGRARLAFKQLEKPDVSEYLVGPTAIALAKDDVASVLKALIEFAKENPVQVKGALVDNTVFDAAQAEELSKLPTREELLAKLMATMNAPLQYLVYAMNGVPQKLVRVLQAVADKKKESE